MRLIGNIVWMLFGGIFTALYWFGIGCLFSITIIGIPLGRQAFKMASLTLAPFGKSIEYGGVINCITIIGIPFGLQSFKMAKLSLLPFGARVLG